MKNLFIALVFAVSLAGCASTGHFIRAEHNGKIYWLPPNCESYQPVAGSDDIMCFGAGQISPTPSDEYEAYLKERELRNYYNDQVFIWVGPSWHHHRHWRPRFHHHRRR